MAGCCSSATTSAIDIISTRVLPPRKTDRLRDNTRDPNESEDTRKGEDGEIHPEEEEVIVSHKEERKKIKCQGIQLFFRNAFCR